MKRLTLFFIGILCLLLTGNGYAQQLTEPLQYYSPNTYSFARYGDLPVDYSRGLPQINIPLFSISDRDLNLDLSLSYHASGIKVDQEASWVGLGWSLNAGGMITVQVRGVPDFTTTAGNSRTDLNFYDSSYANLADYINREWSTLYAAANGATDNAPDIFFYNFCGRAGKFYLDGNRKGQMLDSEDISIEFLTNSTFRITDEKGVCYTFASKEQAYNSDFGGNYTTAWYLTEMVSPAGGKLTFAYTSGGTLSTGHFRRAYTDCFIEVNKDVSAHEIPTQYRTPTFATGDPVQGLVPESITAGDGSKVEFNQRSGKRLDAYNVNGSVLEKLVYKNPAGTVCRKYGFSYSYFQPDNAHRLSLSGYDFLNYRLRLDKVEEENEAGTATAGAYTFAYYGDEVTSTNNVYALPYRLSPCQDHWGYYNHTSNSTIFANNNASTPFHQDGWYYRLNPVHTDMSELRSFAVTAGADRKRHGEAVKACTLKRLTYPTGGSTELEYEPHDVNYTAEEVGMGGIRVSKITDRDALGNTRVRTYSYGNYNWEQGKCIFQSNLYHLYFKQLIQADGSGQSAHLLPLYGVTPQYVNKERLLVIHSTPTIVLGLESDFMYPNVTEYVQGDGRTEYTYRYDFNRIPASSEMDGQTAPYWGESAYIYDSSTAFASDIYYNDNYENSLACHFPYLTSPDLGWMRGQLLSRKVYSESGKLLEEESMTYEDQFLQVVPGYKVLGTGAGTTMNEIFMACDYLACGRTRLTGKSRTEYGTGNGFTTTTTYTYANGYHRLVEEQRSTDSKGETLLTRTRYPESYGSYFNALKTAHILLPIDVRTYRNGTLAEGWQTQYGTHGQPLTLYRAETGGADVAFNASNPYTFTACEWYGYDTTANRLNSVTTRADELKCAYLWAYNRTYPVAKIVGADYAEVSGWIGNAQINSLAANSSTVESALQEIRSTLASKEVEVTTYTYLPGKGMMSMTMPNGHKTNYTYDEFARLSQKRDENGTVEQYEYHQVTEESAPTTTNVSFTNMDSGDGWASAEIVCNGSCRVTFTLRGNLSNIYAFAEYSLAGDYYSYSAEPYNISVTKTLSAGTHTFTVDIGQPNAGDYAELTITAVEAPDTLGTTLTMRAE